MRKIAELWAKYIINNDRDYAAVPAGLKKLVDEVLAEWGYEEYIK